MFSEHQNKTTRTGNGQQKTNVGVIASDIEFLSLVKSLLTDGTELNM